MNKDKEIQLGVYIMTKVGIITINDYNNYGNRLQNYATQEIINSLGCDAETVVNNPLVKKSIFERIKNKSFKHLIAMGFKKIRRKVYRTKTEQKIEYLKKLRYNSFIEFTKENIKETDFEISPGNIPVNLHEKYDMFVVGSDQVWNPNFRQGSPIDFLTFAPKEKRVAFSASFGVSQLSDVFIDQYKKWLKDMPHISVREDAGAKLIKQLIGREVPVLVDPTLVLTKEKWLEIAKPAKSKPHQPYLLTYFLGDVSKERIDWINRISSANNLSIINLLDTSNEDYYTANPSQFLDYLNNCSIFCTDSFHGVVFSILFEKPFIVFDRVSETQLMTSRIDTILSKFNFNSRRWENIINEDDYFNIDFSHVAPILEVERNKALTYLKNALNLKDDD